MEIDRPVVPSSVFSTELERHEEAAMVAIPYNPTRKAVLHPGCAEDFFQLGPIRSDAALCAEMSRLVYVKDEDKDERLLRTYLERGGFTLVKTLDGDSGTYVVLAASTGAHRPTVVVAFRGTEVDDFRDLMTDLRCYRRPWKGGGTVHAGFSCALPDMDALASLVPDGARVLLTGHSLGAALATLAAAWLRRGCLYTFGSPRVGDRAFATSMRGVEHARYVDCCDVVTSLALPIGYIHVGRRYYIDRHGTVVPSLSEPAIVKDRLRGLDDIRVQICVAQGRGAGSPTGGSCTYQLCLRGDGFEVQRRRVRSQLSRR